MLYDTLHTSTRNLHKPLLSKVYFFHDIRIVCQTNHSAILAILDKMLAIFPEPGEVQGEANYFILCSQDGAAVSSPITPQPRAYRNRTFTHEHKTEILPQRRWQHPLPELCRFSSRK